MIEKLSYAEWRNQYYGKVTIAEGVKEDLMQFHNVDANKEIEAVMRQEYEFYLNSDFK